MCVKADWGDFAHAGPMSNAPDLTTVPPATLLARWRDIVWPREHGSWSLALEPLAFGLIAAPSAAGALLAGTVTAVFFARRPLRIAVLDAQPSRRAAARGALAVCALGATGGFAGTLILRGPAWAVWLVPAAVLGAIFLAFDLRNEGRKAVAELAGAAAFAFVPAAMAAMAGWGGASALALGLVMSGRSVPTVLCIRACLREQKTGEGGAGPALAAAIGAVVIAAWFVQRGLAPRAAVGFLAFLALRAGWLLVYPRPTLRARTLGMFEAIYGAGFVLAVGWTWRP